MTCATCEKYPATASVLPCPDCAPTALAMMKAAYVPASLLAESEAKVKALQAVVDALDDPSRYRNGEELAAWLVANGLKRPAFEKPPDMSQRRMMEALYDALIAFARAGGDGPTEIALPRRDFLWLAGDLDIQADGGPRRVAFTPYTPIAFGLGSSPRRESIRTRTVRVGSSFVFQGPTGPVTIREA